MPPSVTLPWPDSRLTPNNKNKLGHWGWRPAATKAREDACILACAQLSLSVRQQIAHGDEMIRGTVTFYPPDRRRRDDDGMIGAFKHHRDGIADALLIDDCRFRFSYEFAEPEKPGRVEVSFS